MFAVRDNQRVVPTCLNCGCRLQEYDNRWFHFYRGGEVDARGCKCPLVFKPLEAIDPNGRFDKDNIVVVY